MGQRYAYLGLSKSEGSYVLRFTLGNSDGSEETTDALPLGTSEIYMRVQVDEGAKCVFSYSVAGDEYQPIGPVFQASKGHWIGAKVGLFCVNREDIAKDEFGEFDWFEVE